jgi:hypothetical protein
MPRHAAGPQCFASLAAQDVHWTRAPSPGAGPACSVADPVRVDETGAVLWNRPAVVDCPLAAALGAFARDVLQPAAIETFGQPIARLHHLGAWDCRRRTGSLFRMSEHAKGRALDLAALELADGTRITVKNDWENGRRGRFLRQVATRACAYFSVVLTPETDRYHEDHLHLDVGPYRACD